MKLSELQPQFYRYDPRVEEYEVVDATWNAEKQVYLCADGQDWNEAGRPVKKITGPRLYLPHVDTLAEAQGLSFLCPLCFRDNGGPVGTHGVHMPFADRGIGATEEHPHLWHVSGTGYDDLSTTPSYLIVGGCGWHGYITNGEVSIL